MDGEIPAKGTCRLYSSIKLSFVRFSSLAKFSSYYTPLDIGIRASLVKDKVSRFSSFVLIHKENFVF
uniref:Uncharacterized protein n=1 Tax=Lepeophtheirus salmonis TaxID=72036 RepID=A0A0K2TL50_LEPSM